MTTGPTDDARPADGIDEPRVLRAYREASAILDEGPAAQTRAAILAAAARAAGARPRPAGWRRWRLPLAAAASLMAGTIALLLAIEAERHPVDQARETVAAAPATDAQGDAALASASGERPAAPPPAFAPPPSSAPSAPAEPAAAAPSAAAGAPPSDKRRAAAPAPAAAAPPAPSLREAPAAATAAPTPGAGMSKETAAAPAAPAAAPAVESGGTPPARPGSAPAVPAAPPAPPAARPDPAPAAAPRPRAAQSDAAADGRTSRTAAEAAASAAEPAPWRSSPERWIERIVKLRGEGRHADADAELAALRVRHPDLRLPAAALPPR